MPASLFRFLKLLSSLPSCLSALSRWGRSHTRDDVIDYVKSNYKLIGFKVGEHPQKSVGDDGYTDYVWTVTEKDGARFIVIDDYYYGHEWVTHSLRDNRNYLRVKEYLRSADISGFTLKDEPNGLLGAITLLYNYTDRQELRRGIERMNAMAAECPAGLTLFFDMIYAHKYRSIGAYVSSAGDTSYHLKRGETAEAAPCEEKMLSVAIDMRYDEVLREFGPERIKAMVRGNNYAFGVLQPDGSYKVYVDLLLNSLGYGISFPTLYELLKRGGYAVSGTKERYAFKGLDGHSYEFSNDFQENQAYYYILDGQRVPMAAYFYNHWHFRDIKAMTGIQCVYYKDVLAAQGAHPYNGVN